MDQSSDWGLARYVTLLVVVAVHLAMLAALIRGSRTESIALAQDLPVELLFLPPASLPKIRPENLPPKHLSANTGISIAPPALDSDSPSLAPTMSESDGTGGGVDWKAEARRAIQAFEIRTRLPPNENALSVSPAEESWWPWARRRGGGPFKTPSGDWIVWITSNCYQIAAASANANASNGTLPHTVCLGKSSAAAGESAVPHSRKQQHPATN